MLPIMFAIHSKKATILGAIYFETLLILCGCENHSFGRNVCAGDVTEYVICLMRLSTDHCCPKFQSFLEGMFVQEMSQSVTRELNTLTKSLANVQMQGETYIYIKPIYI